LEGDEEEAAGEAGVEGLASLLGVDESFCAPLGEGDFSAVDFSAVDFSEVVGSFILLE
jgi:hypothetical protein